MTPVTLARNFYKRHERWMPLAFFVLGFLFDAVMLHRVDELAVLLQQTAYLLLVAALIGVELVETERPVPPPPLLGKVWTYREGLLHFMMGTLLNNYTIFFFKSASSLTPYIFIVVLIVVLMLNEFKHFGKSQVKVHMAFWSLCLIAFLVTLTPILFGAMGSIPFLAAVAVSGLVFAIFYRLMRRRLANGAATLKTHMRLPYLSILVIFVLLYFFRAIPPVPLSVQYMGIFHNVQRSGEQYLLSETGSRWRFWENGDQTFLYRPGDSAFGFARIFAPSRFNDTIHVRWLFKDPRQGWLSADAIPLEISGGREHGYRGVTRKNNLQPGKWRVQVETSDNREIGRIGFTILADESSGERPMRTHIQ